MLPDVNNEIVIYRPDEKSSHLEVRLENETVWLTQEQISELFQTSRNNITLHVGNIFKDKGIWKNSVCKKSLLTATVRKFRTVQNKGAKAVLSSLYPDFVNWLSASQTP